MCASERCWGPLVVNMCESLGVCSFLIQGVDGEVWVCLRVPLKLFSCVLISLGVLDPHSWWQEDEDDEDDFDTWDVVVEDTFEKEATAAIQDGSAPNVSEEEFHDAQGQEDSTGWVTFFRCCCVRLLLSFFSCLVYLWVDEV